MELLVRRKIQLSPEGLDMKIACFCNPSIGKYHSNDYKKLG